MHFDFIDLRLLAAVLETGSITAGAERVGLSLAAASARMRGLEQQAGVALLTRNPRGVQATPAGERLLQHARVLLQQRDRLRGDMAEFAPGQRSQLRIVANTVAADAFLPELLADFLVLHPHTDIALEELPSPAIAQAIAERAADIGIVADHADLRGLASYPFRQDRLVLALPPGHALSGRRPLSFADALPFDFIGLPEQSALQQHLEQLAIRSGGPMRLRARAANFDAICRMVLRGAGLAVVPEESAQRHPEIRHGALPLTDDWATRNLSIVVRERAQLPLPAQRLVAFLRQGGDGLTGDR
ncbi:LysR family transcriptional regulator [Serratia marcescens]|uniref:LysR family transcriptional regulator n=1 Tax=Serratia TaxID=613 RepID=UPI00102209DD|nr:LysR family transcriptional regulator [Serratia marcescens]RZA54835.1 LysR family transcriptional regulator [Serratia marcescens]BEN11125.1 LysR family transcriptional regulator [Serratia marcescens]